MGSSNENSWYGSVANPWNTAHVPGGSSGGSAAAVAAGLAPAATGTDTGGSIRQPAALCGVTGIKPTYGRVSRYGMIAFASSLDQGGPFARSAADCALILQAMAGFDPRDSTSSETEVPDFSAQLDAGHRGPQNRPAERIFRRGPGQPAGRGHRNRHRRDSQARRRDREISLPNTGLSIPTYYVVAMAECSSNLSRFDGVRFGHRCADPVDLEDLYKRSRGEGFGDEVKRRILIGTYALSAGYYDAYYLKAQQLRRMIKDDFQKGFRRRPDSRPDHAGSRFRDRRQDRRPGEHVPAGYLHHFAEPRRPARHVPAGRFRRRPAGRHAVDRQLLRRGAPAAGGASATSRSATGTCKFRRPSHERSVRRAGKP